MGPLGGVGRAAARLLPDRLPAVRDLPAAAVLDRGPRQAVALRERLRDHRRRVRAAELPGGAPGAELHPPARVRHGQRRPGAAHEGRLLRLPAGHGAPLRHPLEVRDDVEEHERPDQGSAPPARGGRAGTRPGRALRRADPGARMILAADVTLPDNSGYVVAAYLVFLALLLIYISIMATKLSRFERELTELNELARKRDERETQRAA